MELYTIGSNIRKYRKQKKFSQEKLAELAMAKINVDKVGDVLEGLGGLFGKK